MGVANFAMHKAVIESRHPYVEDAKRYFSRHIGQNASYGIEFAVLLAAMYFAQGGSAISVAIYCIYTSINAVATWLLLTGRA